MNNKLWLPGNRQKHFVMHSGNFGVLPNNMYTPFALLFVRWNACIKYLSVHLGIFGYITVYFGPRSVSVEKQFVVLFL